ncbi:hypothetical protein BsWGS_02873 [Bradybaena similaris]
MENFKAHMTKILVMTAATTAGIVFPLIALACQTSYDFTSWTDILDSVKAICVVIGICAPILGKFDVRDVRNAGTVLAFLIFCALVTCVDILVYTQTFMSGKRYCVDKEMYMYICDAISLLWEILALFMYLLVISAYHKYSQFWHL